MKKILIYCSLIFLIFSSCQKEEAENPLSKNPDQRLREVLGKYKKQLVESEHGWKAVIFPSAGAGYSFYFKFLPNDRVIMYSDLDENTASLSKESTFRLTTLQRPSLLFDTYSYLHILADPDARKSGGDWGQGKYSDFEFTFDSATPETINLTGVYNKSKLVLTKGTKEDEDNYIKKVAAHVKNLKNVDLFKTYFKRLVVGDKSYDVSFDTGRRFVTFTFFDGTTTRKFNTSYYFDENGLKLLEPFAQNGFTLNRLNNIQFSSNNITFTSNESQGLIRESTSPARIDTQSAQKFFNSTADEYWLAVAGFTIDGVFDAVQVRGLQDFQLLVILPKFQRASNQNLDLLGFFFGKPIEYGTAAVARLSSGRVIYQYYGDLGEVPQDHEQKFTRTSDLWLEPSGFFVVPTEYGYDLVSAKDARSWLSLF
jgi:hypothetical protein